MTIPTSSFNVKRFLKCYKDSLWRNKNSGIFYFLISFVFLPLQYIMLLIRGNNDFIYIARHLSGAGNCYTESAIALFSFFTIAMAITMPITMLSFLHNKRALDVFHSLPFTRNETLGSNLLAGATFLVVPIVLNFSFIALISAGYPFSMPIEIMKEAFFWCVSALGTFAMTSMVCVIVGTVLDSVIFSIGLNAAPIVIYCVLNILGAEYLVGFDDFLFMEETYYLSPSLIMFGRFSENRHNLAANAIWAVLIVLMVFLAFFSYNKRKSEQAETPTDKGILSYFLRMTGTLAGGLLLGSLFAVTLDINPKNIGMLLCSLSGSVIVYYIGDIIISKRVRGIKYALIPAFVFALIVTFINAAFMFDFFGYSRRIPNISDIEAVGLTNYTGRFQNQPYDNQWDTVVYYESPQVIEAVLGYHQTQIDSLNYFSDEKAHSYTSFSRITYKLKNGSTLSRNFRQTIAPDYGSIAKLETADEFIMKNHPLFIASEKSVKNIKTINLYGNNINEIKLSSQEKKALMEALKADMLSVEPTDLTAYPVLGKVMMDIDGRELFPAMYKDDTAESWEDTYMAPAAKETLSEEPYTVQISMAVSSNFQNTLAFFNKIDKQNIFDNNPKEVLAAYIGLDPYSSNNTISTINYHSTFDFQEWISTQSKYDSANGFIELSQKEMQVLADSVRGYQDKNEAHVIILFKTEGKGLFDFDEETDEETEEEPVLPSVKGYGFIPFSSLPPDLQDKVLKKSQQELGRWIAENNGFVVADDETISPRQ